MSHTPCQCQCCVSWNPQGTCTELKSSCYGGDVSPFHNVCSFYLSKHAVFSPKATKHKRWFRVKTMEDMDAPNARL